MIENSSFAAWMPLIFSSSMTDLSQASSNMLKMNGNGGQPCLFTDFNVIIALSFAPFRMTL